MLTKVLLQIYFLEGLINVIDSAEDGDKGTMMPIKSYDHMLPILFYPNDVRRQPYSLSSIIKSTHPRLYHGPSENHNRTEQNLGICV